MVQDVLVEAGRGELDSNVLAMVQVRPNEYLSAFVSLVDYEPLNLLVDYERLHLFVDCEYWTLLVETERLPDVRHECGEQADEVVLCHVEQADEVVLYDQVHVLCQNIHPHE